MIRLLPWLSLVVAAWQSVVSVRDALPQGQADLYVYLLGIHAAANNSPLYEVRAPNGDPFTYPPFAVLVMWPLSWVTQRWANALWTAGTLVVLLLLVVVLAWRKRQEWRPAVWWTVVLASYALLLVTTPSRLNLGLGQVSALITLLTAMDVLVPKRGIFLGVAAAIKLTPLAFVLYLLTCGRARDGWRALAVFVGCSGLALVLFPRDSAKYWTDAVFHMEARLGYLDYVDNQSAQGFLLRTGLPGGLWFAIAGLVMLFALYQGRLLARAGHDELGMLVVGCAVIVASPISWGHHMFWVVLAGLWLVWSFRPIGVAVLAVMLVWPDLEHPGSLLVTNSRLVTALVLACGMLFATNRGVHLVPMRRARGAGHGGSRRRVRRVRQDARRGPPSYRVPAVRRLAPRPGPHPERPDQTVPGVAEAGTGRRVTRLRP